MQNKQLQKREPAPLRKQVLFLLSTADYESPSPSSRGPGLRGRGAGVGGGCLGLPFCSVTISWAACAGRAARVKAIGVSKASNNKVKSVRFISVHVPRVLP